MFIDSIGQLVVGFLKMIIFPLLKLIGKIAIWCGAYWVALPFGVAILYETITGGSSMQDPIISFVCNGLFYLSPVLMGCTTIQSVVRFIKKDNSFNIFKFLWSKATGQKQVIGTQAKSNKDNTVKADEVHGIVFGKDKEKYFIKDEQEKACALIIGGTRSGKTSGIAIPTLKSWQGGVFAIDIKGELYDTTAKSRNIDFVKRFNPCDSSACGYDPFYPLKTARNITQEVKNIALAIIPPTNDGNQKFWVESAQDFLSGAILFYHSFGLNFSESMIEIKTKPSKETVALIMASDNDKAKAKMSQFVGMDDKTLGGIFAEVSRNIDIFATDDDLIHALSGKGDCITPQDLEDGYDIYCCIEEHLIDQWRPLLTMMVNQFFKFFEQRSLDNDKPILFLLDEFPRLGRIESIMGGLSTLAGRNIHLALIIQSKSQLNAVYGKDNANVIADNCGYKAILKATEPETQKWCAELVGKYDKEKKSSNYNANMLGVGKGTGTGKTTEQRFIIEPSDFGYLAENGKLVILAPSGYKMLDKIKWWEDKTFVNC